MNLGELQAVAASEARSDPPPAVIRHLEKGGLHTATETQPPGVYVETLVNCSPGRMWDLLTDFEKLPRHIVGLEEAAVLSSEDSAMDLGFTMKLPYPVGRMSWTNKVVMRRSERLFAIGWCLTGGDLRVNSGRLVMTHFDDRPNCTLARYRVQVETNTRLPRSAQRLATRWLLPRIVKRLRHVAESKG